MARNLGVTRLSSSGSVVLCLALAGGLGLGADAMSQEAAPPGTDLAAFAAKRYPQPVRVGDLIHRTVLQPVESRNVLGRVADVIRLGDGKEAIVMKYGGFWGFGGRYIAVPIDAMVLLGSELEVLDFSPEQLRAFPSYRSTASATTLGADEVIKMGLAHPSH